MVGKIVSGLIGVANAFSKAEAFKPALKKPIFFTMTPKPDFQKLEVKWMTAGEADALAQKNLIERLKAIKEKSNS